MDKPRFKAVTFGSLIIYDAFHGEGAPIIIMDTAGFNINVFVDDEGNIQGVQVSQPETVVGVIPEEAWS